MFQKNEPVSVNNQDSHVKHNHRKQRIPTSVSLVIDYHWERIHLSLQIGSLRQCILIAVLIVTP